jgi:hypothetical protein
MPRIIHPQWREEQEPSKYPFADSASLMTTGGIDIGQDTLLDAHLYPIGGAERMYLSSIVASGDEITFNIGTIAVPALCSVTFNGLNPPDVLRLEDAYERPAGVIVSESIRLSRFQGLGQGTHSFELSASAFAASVCVPTPEVGVRGLVTEDGDILTGDVWIVGENGVVVSEDTVEVPTGQRAIRVDIVGDPLFRRALCDGTITSPAGDIPLFQTVSYLQTINGVSPDEFGDLKITTGSHLTADNILRIRPDVEGVRFEAVGEAARR